MQGGCIAPLVQMLNLNDVKIIQVVLDALSNILKAGEQPDGSNPCADYLEEASGLDVIEELQNHDNEGVYKKCLAIIETYFSEGEEEDTFQQVSARRAGCVCFRWLGMVERLRTSTLCASMLSRPQLLTRQPLTLPLLLVLLLQQAGNGFTFASSQPVATGGFNF